MFKFGILPDCVIKHPPIHEGLILYVALDQGVSLRDVDTTLELV